MTMTMTSKTFCCNPNRRWRIAVGVVPPAAALVMLQLFLLLLNVQFSFSFAAAAALESSTTIGPFQMRLYWTPSSCWHGNCSEASNILQNNIIDWCMQCEGFRCNKGDILWLEQCRYYPDIPQEQLFYWVPIVLDDIVTPATSVVSKRNHGDGSANGGKNNLRQKKTAGQTQTQTGTQKRRRRRRRRLSIWGQIQVKNSAALNTTTTTINDGNQQQLTKLEEEENSSSSSSESPLQVLCLERVGERHYTLQDCIKSKHQQWFRGLDTTTTSGAASIATSSTSGSSSTLSVSAAAAASPTGSEIGEAATTARGAVSVSNPFELYPPPLHSDIPPGIHNNDKCINMHHHPRRYEEIIHTSCEQAKNVSTNLWQTVFVGPAGAGAGGVVSTSHHEGWHPSQQGENFVEEENEEVQESNTMEHGSTNPMMVVTSTSTTTTTTFFNPREYYQLGEPRRDPRCRPEATCGLCEGHCTSDDDCAGSLKCYERSHNNPIETPPGCYGEGIPRIDYCYSSDGN